MPRLNNVQELVHWNEHIRQRVKASKEQTVTIIIGMGTCGLAAGAGEIYSLFEKELTARNIQAVIRSVGCIGMCVQEPLVDIQLTGQPRITYVKVTPARVSRIVEEHILKGNVIPEWIIGYVPDEW